MVLTIAVVIVLVGIVLFSVRNLGAASSKSDERVVLALDSIRESVASTAGANQITLSQVANNLGELRKSSDGLLVETRRLGDLRDAFQLPGARGSIGELLLENLLRDVLGSGQYQLQYSFQDGARVDAVVHIGDKLVPIDSKFPVTEFGSLVEADTAADRHQARRRFLSSVRQHVNSVSQYVKPAEQTVDFALMYIPAENIFHQVILKERGESEAIATSQYARDRKVVIASPNTLYAYLQTVAMAVRSLAIEGHAREVADRISGLTTDLALVQRDLSVLGNHLTNAQNKHGDVEHGITGLERKMSIPSDTFDQPPD